MGCPIFGFMIHFQAGTGIYSFAEWFHGDTILNRTDTDTEIAPHTRFVFDNKLAYASD